MDRRPYEAQIFSRRPARDAQRASQGPLSTSTGGRQSDLSELAFVGRRRAGEPLPSLAQPQARSGSGRQAFTSIPTSSWGCLPGGEVVVSAPAERCDAAIRIPALAVVASAKRDHSARFSAMLIHCLKPAGRRSAHARSDLFERRR